MENSNLADFVPFWNSPDIRKVRHKICEGIVGSGRWEEIVDTVIHKGDGAGGSKWIMTAERRKDIYPLIGGKNKKWIILVQLIDSNGKYSCQRFQSSSGYNKETDHIWPEVRGYVALMTGAT